MDMCNFYLLADVEFGKRFRSFILEESDQV